MAFTSVGLAFAPRNAWRIAPAVASRQVCGCCSFRAGRQVGNQVVGLRAGAQHLAALRVTTSALVDCVPLSMPIKSVL